MSLLTRKRAGDGLADLRAVAQRWQAEHAAALAMLQELEATSGDALLGEPSAAERVAAELRQAQDRVDNAARAVAATAPRLEEAERQVWSAAGREWTTELKRRARTLEAHRAKTAQLLAPLCEHDGIDYAPQPGATREYELEALVRQAETFVRVCEDVAAGEDPLTWLNPRFVTAWDGRVDGLRAEDYFMPGGPPPSVDPVRDASHQRRASA